MTVQIVVFAVIELNQKMFAICQHFESLVLNLIQWTSSSVTGTIPPEITAILFSKDLNLGIFK